MEIRDLIKRLGGPAEVAVRLGIAGKTVSMWGSRGEIPGDYRLAMWRMATEAGLDWTPPGADGLALVPKAEVAA